MPSRRTHRGDRGSITAETAVVLPLLVLLFVTALWGLLLVTAQLGVVDAARSGARAAARGEADAQIHDRVTQALGGPAEVQVTRGDSVVVTVRRRVVPPWTGLRRFWPGVVLHARAVTVPEPTHGGGGP